MDDNSTVAEESSRIPAALSQGASQARRDWKLCFALVLTLAVFYGALQNGRWVPVSDAELYIAIARSLALGHGYRFNGQPVRIVPPGWPVVLAVALKVSSAFWFINLLPMMFLLVAAAIWYWVLRRFVTPGRSFLAALGGATLYWWYHSTVVLHSEALFCLLLSAACLLALRIRERKSRWVEMAGLLLACAALPVVRWAGVAAWTIVAAALLCGQRGPGWSPRAIVKPVLMGLVAIGSFVGTRYVVSESGLACEGEPLGVSVPRSVVAGLPAITDRGFRTAYSWFSRFAKSGHWVCNLFWMPCQLGRLSPLLGVPVNLVGWTLIVAYCFSVLFFVRKGAWLWVGVLLYCAALIIRWNRPNARYLTPVAPLLIVGVWSGMEHLTSLYQTLWWKKVGGAIRIAFVPAVLLCNLSLLATDVVVARSEDFYATYYAGQAEGIVAAGYYLGQRHLRDGELAVSARYVNLKHATSNGFGLRSMNLLTNRVVRMVPPEVCCGPPNEGLIEWARRERVRFYLYRPPVSPWRVWHFRMPWLQRRLNGGTVVEKPYWELYELEGGRAVKLDVPHVRNWPSGVPGV